jgi:hypothetical protein
MRPAVLELGHSSTLQRGPLEYSESSFSTSFSNLAEAEARQQQAIACLGEPTCGKFIQGLAKVCGEDVMKIV